MSALPELKIPGYTIIRELGHGGMAVVYLAIQESFGREVALKVLTPDRIALDESFTERFIREAKIVSSLVHPNIVTVYDVGVYEGHHYLSMEYVAGQDLKQAQSSLNRRELLRVIKDVARALDYAGSKGYVHRDVKPENIMIHENDGRVILMDFGIAHGLDTSMEKTRHGKAIGTPYYMSPEQSKGKPVDHRSDIYSLGVVLYQMLTGFVPYDAGSPISVGIKHITEPIPILPKRLKMLQPTINTAMSKDPHHRYQSAAELIKALDSIDQDELDRIEAEMTAFKMAGKDYDASTIDGDAVPEIISMDKGVIEDLPRISPQAMGHAAQINERHTRSSRLRFSYVVYVLLFVAAVGAVLKKNELVGLWKVYEPQLSALFSAEKDAMQVAGPTGKNGEATTDAARQSDSSRLTVIPQEGTVAPSQAQGELDSSSVDIAASAQTASERINALRLALDQQPENAVELAGLYKGILSTNPQDLEARQGIRDLRQWYREGIQVAKQQRDTEKMRQLIGMLESSFPKASSSPKFMEYKAMLERLEVIESHAQRAEQYSESQAWVQPPGANALEEWRAVIALEAGNPQAQEGLVNIVNGLHARALAQEKKGKYQLALNSVKQGLQVAGSDKALLALEKKLMARLKTEQQVWRILKQANTAFSTGHLISPEKQNAYALYQSVFKLDKNNRKAKKGLQRIEKQLISYIDAAIGQGDLDKAGMTLDAAKQRFTNSELLLQAELRLLDAVAEVQPKVTNIQFSATQLDALNGSHNERLRLGRTLYIGFRYKNFEAVTTLLQAVLLDGTGRVQIAQKPVIVSGEAGDHFFDMELPVEGFAEGSYKLELVMGNESLIAESFLVDNRGGN